MTDTSPESAFRVGLITGVTVMLVCSVFLAEAGLALVLAAHLGVMATVVAVQCSMLFFEL